MATLPFKPISGYEIQPIQSHRKFSFGDNYQQRQPIGVNQWKLMINGIVFQFDSLNRISQMPTLAEGITFFMSIGTTIPFEFDVFGFQNNPAFPVAASGKLQWVCNSWRPRHVSGSMHEIVADFETWRAAAIEATP